MEFGVALVTLACYGLAGALWWYDGKRQYLFALLSGHVAALLSPLWVVLYGIVYNPGLGALRPPLGAPIPTALVLASAWIYPLPALVVLFLYHARWWFPGYVTGLLTYLVMLLYHLLIQLVGLRSQAWAYAAEPLSALPLPPALVSAALAALVSLGVLYALLLVGRYALLSQLLTLLPATLLLSLGVHGLLGGPLWVPLLLRLAPLSVPPWLLSVGLLFTLALLAWAIHIGAWSLGHIARRFAS
jgi:hypothetical protein